MALGFFPAGCFGKLPIYGDFIRYHAGGVEAGEFDLWLQTGLEFAKRRNEVNWPAAYSQAPSYHFLFHAQSPERFLVGILQPSRDQSGREFPFAAFLLVDRERFGNNVTMAPVIFREFLEHALLLAQQAPSVREILSAVERLQFSIPANWEMSMQPQQQWLAAMTTENLWTRLFGSFADQRKFLLFNNLTKILLRLRQYNPAQLTRGLRFPLPGADAGEAGLAHETSFWLQVCWRILRKPVLAPTLFWTAPSASGRRHLFLFFRRPSQRSLLPLLNLAPASDVICALDEAGNDSLTDSEFTIALPYRMILRDLLQQKDLTLHEFLQNL